MYWETYFQPTTLDATLQLLAEHHEQARIIAGGTDVLVELQRGVKPTKTLIDITCLTDLKYVRSNADQLLIGALATHNDVVASSTCVARALPLAQACWEVGAPQIRARATVAGNLVTASPANDTITPLMALDATVVLSSQTGERSVPLSAFYTGVRRTVLRRDELLREIQVPLLKPNQAGIYLKLGLRRAQAISVIDVAVVLTFAATDAQAPDRSSPIVAARIALGSVAPTIVRASTAEAWLYGKTLTPEVCQQAGVLAQSAANPIDDVRGSADYRRLTTANLVTAALQRLADATEAGGWPERVVLLETASPVLLPVSDLQPLTTIETQVNGQRLTLPNAQTQTLLDTLRDQAGLTGAKEGCAEGECGACTVWLNGQAVMSCLVPAAQAHGGEIVTIEGLAATRSNGALHPLQQAFIDHAAVQCGFCIPGMIMAGAKLLDEHAQPTTAEVQTALSGNICRCTGYRKILDAVHAAANHEVIK